MQIWLILTLLLAIFCCCQGDTRTLQSVNIFSDDALREETFSLRNAHSEAEEIVIKGTYSYNIYPKDNGDFMYRVETIYVADKDGYRVKYKLIREPYKNVVLSLNPSTLKSLTG